MEHSCHRCGDPVPESSPFCPECGAPQVRFDRSESPATNVAVCQPEQIRPSSRPIESPAWNETTHRVAGRERAVVLRAALNGGVIAAILSLVPFVFIIGMPLGGFLAVFFYRRRSWRAEPSLAGGFRLGVLAGLFASAILGIVIVADASASNHRAEYGRQLIERFQTMESRTSDPEQRQAMKQIIEYVKTPQGMTAAIILTVVIMAVIFVVLSGLGGMLSASILHRKGPRA